MKCHLNNEFDVVNGKFVGTINDKFGPRSSLSLCERCKLNQCIAVATNP